MQRWRGLSALGLIPFFVLGYLFLRTFDVSRPLQAGNTHHDAGPCRVTRVVDGDTVHVACPGFADKVRLLNIDTPERGAPGFHEATRELEVLVGGEVYLDFERPGQLSRGRYGRVLAYLYDEGGTKLNAEMIRRGHSGFYTGYGEGRYPEDFKEAER